MERIFRINIEGECPFEEYSSQLICRIEVVVLHRADFHRRGFYFLSFPNPLVSAHKVLSSSAVLAWNDAEMSKGGSALFSTIVVSPLGAVGPAEEASCICTSCGPKSLWTDSAGE